MNEWRNGEGKERSERAEREEGARGREKERIISRNETENGAGVTLIISVIAATPPRDLAIALSAVFVFVSS